MNRARSTILSLIAGLLMLPAVAAAETPEDLVGTWKGYIAWRAGRNDYGFTVKSVEAKDGKWEVAGESLRSKSPIPMTATVLDGRVILEYSATFRTNQGPVWLKFEKGGQVLRGQVRLQGGDGDREVVLEKQKQ